MSTILDAMLGLHPFYEAGCVLSLLTPLIRNRSALRLAVVSVQAFHAASTITEAATINFEAATWNLLNLLFSLYMLAGLLAGGAASRSFPDRRLLRLGRERLLRGLRRAAKPIMGRGAGIAIRPEVWISDRLFF